MQPIPCNKNLTQHCFSFSSFLVLFAACNLIYFSRFQFFFFLVSMRFLREHAFLLPPLARLVSNFLSNLTLMACDVAALVRDIDSERDANAGRRIPALRPPPSSRFPSDLSRSALLLSPIDMPCLTCRLEILPVPVPVPVPVTAAPVLALCVARQRRKIFAMMPERSSLCQARPSPHWMQSRPQVH